MDLPKEFTEKMKDILGEEYQAFLDCYQQPRQYGLRVNTMKITPEELKMKVPFSLSPIPWVENGFYYEEGDIPSRHPYYFAGLYYLQEPSAMTPASRLPVEPGERVLDLCAAPGGKATELGARLKGQGLLAANDISASRAKALVKNVEVFGIPNSFLLNEVPGKLAENFPEFFDKILVDAPCSGEGMFRKEPEVAAVWTPEKPEQCARQQKEIIAQAVRMLRPGGKLLYSTCTFSPEENEQVIAWILQREPSLEILELEGYEGFCEGRPELADGNEELKKCVRIWPHKMAGEGHFMALLQKTGEAPGKTYQGKTTRATRQEEEVIWEFLEKLVDFPVEREYLEVRKGQAYYVPGETAGRRGLKFLRNGLYLGEVKKDRFQPSQSLAMALKPRGFDSCINLSQSDVRVYRYLKGETITVDDVPVKNPKGWQLVCVDGYPLGWGKLVNGLLKNKYVSGWRIHG